MNLQTTIDFDLKRFFKWWGGELAFLVPAGLKNLISENSGFLLITPETEGFALAFYRDQTQPPAFTRHIDSTDNTSYRDLLQQHPELQKSHCLLSLGPDQGLMRTLYLPLAAQENLQQVVSFELDRYTPFTAEQVYFSVVPLGKTEYEQLQVLLVVTPRLILDDLLGELQGWGIFPQRVKYSESNATHLTGTLEYNLLPERFQPRVSLFSQLIHWGLNIALLALLLGVMILPVWQESQAVSLLKAEIKALENETQVIEEQQRSIESLRERTQRLIDSKEQAPSLVEVLNELSALLKDDTWLTHFQYNEKHMQIQGQSPAASALIGVLEASDFFNNVSFVSPLTQDKATGRERFQISMDVNVAPHNPDNSEDQTDEQPESSADAPAELEPADGTAP